jgi:protein TonB
MSVAKNKDKVIKYIPTLVVIVAVLLSMQLIIWLKNWLAEAPAMQKKQVQQITMIRPPPPPPPPEETPPEPEVEEIEQPLEEEMAEEMPEESSEPVGADLGIDADGTGGGDSFGLVGKKGGRGLLSGGPFAWYEGVMVSEIQDLLSTLDDLKSVEYNLKIKLKVGFDGTVERIFLISTTGDKEKDKRLLSALNSLGKFSRMPPGKMPPVVTLKITSTI